MTPSILANYYQVVVKAQITALWNIFDHEIDFHNVKENEIDEIRKATYTNRARFLLNCFKLYWFPAYDGSRFHLDHKYSISEGWKNKISLNIICNRNNLELVPKMKNLSKSKSCSITKTELMESYQPDSQLDKAIELLTTRHYDLTSVATVNIIRRMVLND